MLHAAHGIQVENMMTGVQGGIQDLRDKQEIAEAQLQLQLAKLQLLKAGSQSKHQCSNVKIKSVQQQGPNVHRQGDQRHPSPASGQPHLPNLPSNVIPNTHHDKLSQAPADTTAQLPRQLSLNQSHLVQHPIHRPSLQNPDSTNPLSHPQTPLNTLRLSSHQANQLPNDDSYMGSFSGHVPHGSGKYLWADRCMYEGEWKRGKALRKGKFSWSSVATYEGDFKWGRTEGFGTFTGSDGDTYCGSWIANRKHGFGEKRYANGNFYKGSGKKKLQDGKGCVSRRTVVLCA